MLLSGSLAGICSGLTVALSFSILRLFRSGYEFERLSLSAARLHPPGTKVANAFPAYLVWF